MNPISSEMRLEKKFSRTPLSYIGNFSRRFLQVSEARRFGLTVEKALKRLVAVWRFDSFHGLLLSFEPAEEESYSNE